MYIDWETVISYALKIEIFLVDKERRESQSTDGIIEVASGSNATNNFPSLSSEEGYHMGTPPTLSLESEIQPCAIDIDNTKLEMENTEASSVSSEYKVITDNVEEKDNLEKPADILGVDSSTDDQMSSGNFSQDEMSPRYADLPASLSVEKRRTQSTTEPPRKDSFSEVTRRSSVKDNRTMSMETRSTSIASDVSDQEIPPSTPRSDPTVSPSTDATDKFEYGENVEKSTDIMTQSIYVGSDDVDSELSSESHLSTVQTTQQTISSSEDSKVTTMVTEESSVFESVIKMSENVTENILEETKTITKSTKMAVEESIVLQKEGSDSSSDEKLLKKDSDQKKQSITLVSTESSVMVTKTDTRTYSDVLKSDKYSDSKQTVTTSSVSADNKSSLGKEAVSEVLKSESVLQMVGSSSASSSSADEKTKKLSYSDVVKADSKDKEDPIADWGKPLGLPSPIRPSTPAKQPKKNEDDSMDTNKVR